MILPYNQDTLWPGGTFAGAIGAHAGSFSGKNADDLVIVQNGNLAVAQNTAGNATTWTMTSNITKPACSTCTNYNDVDWSAVRQMIAIPSTAGGRPSIMTLEFWNDNIQLLLYTPTATGIGFNTPTKIAGNYSDFCSWTPSVPGKRSASWPTSPASCASSNGPWPRTWAGSPAITTGSPPRWPGPATTRRGSPASEVDSCHRIWYELHEDLIATLGITR
ncbi:hypothetical protein AB0M46_04485 [Dactylosporangium sp. NPDC051485]|uniref:hypothetical protein n=1 Tax=Dactylosporangium sp. NPDC051485 TaxID=3154846 RepID=UPI0034199796